MPRLAIHPHAETSPANHPPKERRLPIFAALLMTATALPGNAGFRDTERALDGVAPGDGAAEPIARFGDAVCVGSHGLPDTASRVIEDRIAALASATGARVAPRGCSANVLILFVPDAGAAFDRLSRTGSAATESQTPFAVRRIAAERGPVRAWMETELRSRDGDRPQYPIGQTPGLPVATSSHLSLPIRRDVLSSTVLIDRDAVAGRDLRQVADYAAMRALTGARPDARLGHRSILSLFTAAETSAPTAATAFDTGYLKGLYRSRADLPATMAWQTIVATIRQMESATR